MHRPNRRYRPIGPFFLIAIVLSAAIFIWQKRQNEVSLQNTPPPIVEHQVIDGPLTESVPPPDLVRDHAAGLGLTAAQIRRLNPVVSAYEREVEPLQAEVNAAVARFRSRQEQRQEHERVQISQMQEQMSEVSELSGRLVALRRQYWQQVAPILTPAQKTAALKLWQQRLSRAPSSGQIPPGAR